MRTPTPLAASMAWLLDLRWTASAPRHSPMASRPVSGPLPEPAATTVHSRSMTATAIRARPAGRARITGRHGWRAWSALRALATRRTNAGASLSSSRAGSAGRVLPLHGRYDDSTTPCSTTGWCKAEPEPACQSLGFILDVVPVVGVECEVGDLDDARFDQHADERDGAEHRVGRGPSPDLGMQVEAERVEVTEPAVPRPRRRAAGSSGSTPAGSRGTPWRTGSSHRPR